MKYFLLLLVIQSCADKIYAQKDIKPINKIAYLLIDDNIDYKCQNYPNSDNFKDVKLHKSEYEEVVNFFICRHKFVASKSDIEVLTTDEFQKLNLWSFGQMQYERLRKGYIRFNDCFKAIYFIEKTGINEYKKYLVTWESARNMNRMDIDSRH